MSNTPSVVLVPGYWEGVAAFDQVTKPLQSAGYSTVVVPLESTGRPASQNPRNPSMYDDIDGIRGAVKVLVEQGQDVVLVLHSAAGFLGSNAIEGLSKRSRSTEGKAGGVRMIVFICAAIHTEGFKHGPLPFFDYQGDRLMCKSPRELLFNDIPDEAAEALVASLSCQPASNWDGEVTYAGWREIPSVYLVCEKDALIPPALQRMMAESAGSRTESVSAGHMINYSQPDSIVKVVLEAIKHSV